STSAGLPRRRCVPPQILLCVGPPCSPRSVSSGPGPNRSGFDVTVFWALSEPPSGESHRNVPSRAALRCFTSRLGSDGLSSLLPRRDDVIDQTIRLCFFGVENFVAFDVLADLVGALSGMSGHDLLEERAHAEDLSGLDLDVASLAAALGGRLVDQHPGVGQREPLARRAAG